MCRRPPVVDETKHHRDYFRNKGIQKSFVRNNLSCLRYQQVTHSTLSVGITTVRFFLNLLAAIVGLWGVVYRGLLASWSCGVEGIRYGTCSSANSAASDLCRWACAVSVIDGGPGPIRRTLVRYPTWGSGRVLYTRKVDRALVSAW